MSRLERAARIGATAFSFAMLFICVVGTATLARAADNQEFFAGKTISLIISTGPGGGLDSNARIIAKHLANHIPGKPAIVPMNMPGAGALRAANHLYNVAPKDGTVLGTLIPAFVLAQVVDGRGIQYDAAKFQWLGSTSSSNDSIYAWSASGIRSIDDAFKRQVVMGGTGVGSYSTIYPTVLNNVLGTKFKIIAGYQNTGGINIAMQRGEIEGRAGNNLSTIRATTPDWLRDEIITLLVQVGLKRDPEFPDVPLMTDLAKTDRQREVLRLFSTDIVIGRALLAPPGIPPERLDLLRQAFDAMLVDPAFLQDEAAARLDVQPVRGTAVQKIVEDMVNTPPAVVAAGRAAMAPRDVIERGTSGDGPAPNGQ